MFGYVNVNKESLSKKDREIYQSYYCGLCHVLHEQSGRKGQLLLNYDMTFLIILLSGLYELDDEKARFVCPLHPATRKVYRINDATRYAADMNVLLSYQNFADDYKDEGSKKKRLMMNIFRKEYRRIFAEYPRQGAAVEKCMHDLWEAEERGEENVDVVAGITGEMLAEIFAWDERMWYEDLKTLGFYLGKFIYLMDAYEDIEKDVKDHSYNVLAKTYRYKPQEFDAFSKMLLTSMMSECAKTFERMPIVVHGEIIRNILYSGIWTKFRLTYAKRHKEEIRRDQKRKKRREKITKHDESI